MTEDELIARVAMMRRLGITKLDGIELGPEPTPEPAMRHATDEDRKRWHAYLAEMAEYEKRLELAHVEDPGEPPVAPDVVP